jgi:hypothetical protein
VFAFRQTPTLHCNSSSSQKVLRYFLGTLYSKARRALLLHKKEHPMGVRFFISLRTEELVRVGLCLMVFAFRQTPTLHRNSSSSQKVLRYFLGALYSKARRALLLHKKKNTQWVSVFLSL